MRAAHPVDLPGVGADRGDQHAVTQRLILRQHVAQEVKAFRAAAAHQETRNSRLHEGMLRKSAPRNNGSRRGALATMRRALGGTGIEVYAIGLGAMPLSIQGRPDERTALEVITAFL